MKSTIENIVKETNETILRQLKSKTGEDLPAHTYGIAFPIHLKDEESGDSVTAIIGIDGVLNYVMSDDSIAFGLYHRLRSKSYKETKGFGDADLDTETSDMSLIVWGFSNRLGMGAIDFEREIIIPSIPPKASLIASDFDAYRVVNGEFKGINYLFKPDEFIFSVKYKVESQFDRKYRLGKNCV